MTRGGRCKVKYGGEEKVRLTVDVKVAPKESGDYDYGEEGESLFTKPRNLGRIFICEPPSTRSYSGYSGKR
jgi:hypothetical protein